MRRLYDPVPVCCEAKGTRARLFHCNEWRQRVSGELRWRLLALDGEGIQADVQRISVAGLACGEIAALDLKPELQPPGHRERYLAFEVIEDDSGGRFPGTACFVPYKQINFLPPRLQVSIKALQTASAIEIRAAALAKFVALDLSHSDIVFSDNDFDLNAGKCRRVTVTKNGTTKA